MAYVGVDINYGNIAKQTATSSGSTTPTGALTYSVPSSESIMVMLDGVTQVPGTDFNVTGGTTFTFTTSVPSGVVVLVYFLGRSLDIGTPGASTVDSGQIVSGAIDEAHIANDAVNFATHLKAGTDGELITWDASGDPAAVAVGTATHVLTSNGAGAAPTFQAASGGGDVRNFIIDGDFTQWPEGTSFAAIGNNVYASALWRHEQSTTVAVHTLSRHTDIPTVAQSKHQSAYSMDWNCTTIDASIGADDLKVMQYYITGSDFTYLHQQQVTLAFWIKATVTGTQGGSFVNSAYDRSYPFSFTVNDADTWEYKTVSLTMDTSGTWVFTEADIGTRVRFCVVGGSARIGTANTWQAGNVYGPTGIVNNASSTSNIYRIAQVGLYLGSSAPSYFLGESISKVKRQVDWYVMQRNFDSASSEFGVLSGGFAQSTTRSMSTLLFPRLRRQPTITLSAASTFSLYHTGGSGATTSVSVDLVGFHGGRFNAYQTSLTVGQATMVRRKDAETCYILLDARH